MKSLVPTKLIVVGSRYVEKKEEMIALILVLLLLLQRVGGYQAGDAQFMQKIKEFRKLNSPKKLLNEVKTYQSNAQLTPSMTSYAFITLTRMNKTAFLPDLINIWENVTVTNAVDAAAALVLIKGYSQVKRLDLVERVMKSIEIDTDSLRNGRTNDALKGLILPELVYTFMLHGEYSKSYLLLQLMDSASLPMSLQLSKNIMKLMLKSNVPVYIIRNSLRIMIKLGGLCDNDSIQLLTNTFMRSIDFVKGAVSVETLPPMVDDAGRSIPEVCFIGRSNVGKSSLINMISNRKGLAFTSKTPGKTSEFNYFIASSSISNICGSTGSSNQFYVVDLPGVGYAEVDKNTRAGWLTLLKNYTTTRSTLRVIFHLIDSRHGLLEADEQCLSLLPVILPETQYVIVLTKADKRGYNKGIVAKIRREIDARVDNKFIPMILTSSETRYGGTALWSNLLDCIAVTTEDNTTRKDLLSLEKILVLDNENDNSKPA